METFVQILPKAVRVILMNTALLAAALVAIYALVRRRRRVR